MASRLELNTKLTQILGSDNVYFQPPENLRMQYPCIRYERDRIDTKFADNNPFSLTKRYQVVVIDPNPDSEIPDKVSRLQLCQFDRHYVADNLYHDVFILYF